MAAAVTAAPAERGSPAVTTKSLPQPAPGRGVMSWSGYDAASRVSASPPAGASNSSRSELHADPVAMYRQAASAGSR